MTEMKHTLTLSLLLLLLISRFTMTAGDVKHVPDSLQLSSFYKKYCDAEGIPVVSSAVVSNEALVRAARILPLMLAKRADVKQAMIDQRCKVMIIGEQEEVCDLPEYAHICDTPEHVAYWNRRARGFGGAPEDAFSASCGEENLLCLEGDRYAGRASWFMSSHI